MFKAALLRKLKDAKGAMDKVIVTLLLVVIGIGAVAGLTAWMNSQSSTVQTAAETKLNAVIAE